MLELATYAAQYNATAPSASNWYEFVRYPSDGRGRLSMTRRLPFARTTHTHAEPNDEQTQISLPIWRRGCPCTRMPKWKRASSGSPVWPICRRWYVMLPGESSLFMTSSMIIIRYHRHYRCHHHYHYLHQGIRSRMYGDRQEFRNVARHRELVARRGGIQGEGGRGLVLWLTQLYHSTPLDST